MMERWYGYDRYAEGKFDAGYLLDRDQEQELREVGKFNCTTIAERVADLLNLAFTPAEMGLACSCQGGDDQPTGVQLRANDCPVHGLEDRDDD